VLGAVGGVVLLAIVGGLALSVRHLATSNHSSGSGSVAAAAAPTDQASPAATQAAGTQAAGAAANSCTWQPATGNPDAKNVGTPPTSGIPRSGTRTMTITTNLGVVTVQLDAAATPCTAASFAYLGSRHFFDKTNCHRLVNQGIFVLQCGDPTGTGGGGPTYQYADENLAAAASGYKRGMVAMANAGPGTNGSQFFIVFKDSPLPNNYTPFGTVTKGLDVIDRVAAGGDDGAYAANAGGGHPKVTITIQSLTVS
jgi:peptidyl-prolyl cis-trans isomerase B (cyclophilin B)